MQPGQLIMMKTTNSRYQIIEVNGDQAIAAGWRTGARIMVTRTDRGYYARGVTDNGRSGASLFDSLDPAGPRYAMWTPSR